MDLMIITYMTIFAVYWRTYRVCLAYIMFFGVRTFIQVLTNSNNLLQKTFFMYRPDGFLWSFPGVYSLTVPYHDTNDFFYSGHVGTCFLITLEYWSAKWYKMSYFTVFILLNQWILMTFVRTHYIIDLVTGVIMAHYCHMASEWIIYFFDVLVVGSPSDSRFNYCYKPCECCGWSNKNASFYMEASEERIIRRLNSKMCTVTMATADNEKNSNDKIQALDEDELFSDKE